MGIKNSKELGSNLLKIINRLLENKNLLRLLKYTNNDPLDITLPEIDKTTMLNHNILIVPSLNSEEYTTESKIVFLYKNGSVGANRKMKKVNFEIIVFCPFTEWIINDSNLRPFAIMGEIETSLKDKSIDGIGVINYTDFEYKAINIDIGCYRMEFDIDVFN